MKFPITPELHEKIKKVYLRDTGNGQVAALAKRINYPRWKITRYAIQQGWIAKQKKEPNWTDKEIWILLNNAHLSPPVIQRKFKKAGFFRAETGIVLKRKRLKLLSRLEGYSARQLAILMGVDDHNITKKIKDGKLKCHKRHTNRKKVQGGDIYYIKDSDVRNYILSYLEEIDIRKVDKYWFVGLLMEDYE